MNINGTKKENAGESMIFIFDKIDNQYFSSYNVDEHTEDYVLDELNININVPTEVQGEATLTGNININSALKALEDVNLSGEVKNTNDSVIFSKYGDIIIDSQNVNLNGLVYAPFGVVDITAQNLNLNNVVIIADSIRLNCPNVNANYGCESARFVGGTTEPLDIPDDEWQYMKDENENNFPDFFENPENWGLLKDSDGDRLPDCVEQHIGTDADLVDTDSDMLNDYYEIFVTATDPTLPDSDSNGITDGNEDFDNDGLKNFQEAVLKTSPWDNDTDSDGLTDSEEVDNYGTNPLEPDTDFDGLSDPDEITLGTNPNLADTDGNGTIDGKEHFHQTIEKGIAVDDEKVAAITKVSVSMDCSGIIDDHVSIENVYEVDVLSSDVVGIVGAPVDITTDADYNSATITFYYDETLLNDTPEENLAILWYDEINDRYVILDEDTVVDTENNTVSYKTTHFSTYLVIDREIWYDCWRENIDYRSSGSKPKKAYDIAFVVDVSGSMNGDYLENAKTALNTFIDAMYPCDNACLITFNSKGNVERDYGSSISELKSAVGLLKAGGGTSTNSGLEAGLDELIPHVSAGKEPMVVLLCDGDVDNNDYTTKLINRAKSANPPIKIYTVNLCDSNSAALEYLSNETHGQPYKATTSAQIGSVMATLQQKTVSSVDMTDTDGDGLYDVYEVDGMKIQNGKIIKTDPKKADSDDDGVSDFDEIGCAPLTEVVKFAKSEYSCVLFKSKSDPVKQDSDMDYYPDGEDPKPKKFNTTEIDLSIIDDSEMFSKKLVLRTKDTTHTITKSQREIMSTSCGGGVTEIMKMPENGEKAASNYLRDNDHKVQFLIDEHDSPNCIIMELEFPSERISDYVFATDDIVRFAKKANKKHTNFILNKEKVGNCTIKYTLATESNQKYIIDIDSDRIASEFSVKVYEETYVYAPHGGITFGNYIVINSSATYTDYKAVYLDEATLKLLTNYDNNVENLHDLGLVNSMAANNLMYRMKNSDFDKYEDFNELMASGSLAATYASVPLILVSSSNAAGWAILGISLTLAGAGSTAYCSFNNITSDSLEHNLNDILCSGNLNVCLACYDEQDTVRYIDLNGNDNNYSYEMTSFPFFNAEWNNWNGKYISRIMSGSVLNVGVNLKCYDVDSREILDFDSIIWER
jgi:uncharacterized protein YegL